MQVLNQNSVVVFSSSELKSVLEGENDYNYIYFGSNITLEEGITISKNKENVVIDGTYLDVKYNYIVDNIDSSYVITASLGNKRIIVRNINLTCCNTYGIVCCPASNEYADVLIEYNNVIFNGVQMGYNQYGSLRIIDSIVTIEQTNGVEPQEAGEAAHIEVGGNTTITSTSSSCGLFYYLSNIVAPTFKFLPYSRVNLRNESKEFMQGTTRLVFKVLHDAEVNLVTGNGFSGFTIHGAINVLIDERASFTFIETKHQRIPMWTIYGTLTVKEGATFQVINTYDNTPSDNYNIHFKGSSCKFILDNPKSVILYTKNSNVIYTNNALEFSLNVSRLNMWSESSEFTLAGDINNLPEYSWYKKNELLKISGIFSSIATSITSHNLTSEELKSLPDIGNFAFQSRKQFSVGSEAINIDPITSNSKKISGYTIAFAEVLIKYNNTQVVVDANSEGLFTYEITDSIVDNTSIEITTCVAGSFVYTTRVITSPHEGELTIMDAPSSVNFLLKPISKEPVILPKVKDFTIKIIDSRLNSSSWKIFVTMLSDMISENGFNLDECVVFKNFDDELISLNKNPILIYTGSDNSGSTKVYNITWSQEKGLLLCLVNNALEINEEYFTKLKWTIEE